MRTYSDRTKSGFNMQLLESELYSHVFASETLAALTLHARVALERVISDTVFRMDIGPRHLMGPPRSADLHSVG